MRDTATEIMENAKARIANLISLNLICYCNLVGKTIEKDGYYRVHGEEIDPNGIKTTDATIETMVVRDYDGYFIFSIKEEDTELAYGDVPMEMLVDISNAIENKIFSLKYGMIE